MSLAELMAAATAALCPGGPADPADGRRLARWPNRCLGVARRGSKTVNGGAAPDARRNSGEGGNAGLQLRSQACRASVRPGPGLFREGNRSTGGSGSAARPLDQPIEGLGCPSRVRSPNLGLEEPRSDQKSRSRGIGHGHRVCNQSGA